MKRKIKHHLKDLSSHISSSSSPSLFSLLPYFLFFFLPQITQLHSGEVNGCLSACSEPPLICTQDWSSTANALTWQQARAFVTKCRAPFQNTSADIIYNLPETKFNKEHIWDGFFSAQHPDHFLWTQPGCSSNCSASHVNKLLYATDSCCNNVAFILCYQRARWSKAKVPTWQGSNKHGDICMLIGHSKGNVEGVASWGRVAWWALKAQLCCDMSLSTSATGHEDKEPFPIMKPQQHFIFDLPSDYINCWVQF